MRQEAEGIFEAVGDAVVVVVGSEGTDIVSGLPCGVVRKGELGGIDGVGARQGLGGLENRDQFVCSSVEKAIQIGVVEEPRARHSRDGRSR